MDLRETTRLLQTVAVVDNRTVDELTITVWCDLLADMPLTDSLTAVREHRREHPSTYLTPGHVVDGVRRIRRDRLARVDPTKVAPPLDLDPDDPRAYQAWLRATNRAIADGTFTPAPEPRGVTTRDMTPALTTTRSAR